MFSATAVKPLERISPVKTPAIVPMVPISIPSTKKILKICDLLVPTARITPISYVRSFTVMNKVLKTMKAQTTSATATITFSPSSNPAVCPAIF
jgi:hypothetical protein